MNKNDAMYQLLVLLSRVTNIDEQKNSAYDLMINSSINWDRFIAICFKQKVAGLVFANINLLGLSDLVPFRCYNVLHHFFVGNAERNKVIFDYLKKLIDDLHHENVDARPLKGSVLIPLIYQELGCRVMNDIDIFIDKDSIRDIIPIMDKLGFIQGDYSRVTKNISPMSQKESLIWKLKMFNLPPFRKIVNSIHINILNVDFTFGLSFSDSKDVCKKLLAEKETISDFNTLSRVDFFIHLCCHLFKEASNEAWIGIGQDINLIKFCDIREFLLSQLSLEDIPSLQERLSELKILNAVYFALSQTQLIYQEPKIETFLDAIKVEDTSFMNLIYKQSKEVVSERSHTIPTLITAI
jgi:hypothetical protein